MSCLRRFCLFNSFLVICTSQKKKKKLFLLARDSVIKRSKNYTSNRWNKKYCLLFLKTNMFKLFFISNSRVHYMLKYLYLKFKTYITFHCVWVMSGSSSCEYVRLLLNYQLLTLQSTVDFVMMVRNTASVLRAIVCGSFAVIIIVSYPHSFLSCYGCLMECSGIVPISNLGLFYAYKSCPTRFSIVLSPFLTNGIIPMTP